MTFKVYEVVSEGKSKSIPVCSESSAGSSQLPDRLQAGSLVKVTDSTGARVFYELELGFGPDSGWVQDSLLVEVSERREKTLRKTLTRMNARTPAAAAPALEDKPTTEMPAENQGASEAVVSVTPQKVSDEKNQITQRDKERERSSSPTRTMWENRLVAGAHIQAMKAAGLHVFDTTWSDYHSGNFRYTTLVIHGSDEQIVIPTQVCTKVLDVKEAVAAKSMVLTDTLRFMVKQGCSWKMLKNEEEIGSKVYVKGIKSFKPQPPKRKFPSIIIGCGYNGLKCGLWHLKLGDSNFTMFEKYDRVGGHAWLVQANKTSKLQTDMAAFHVWFGGQWGADGEDRLSNLRYPTDWSTWPKKDEVIAHMQHVAERSGMLPMIKFNSEIKNLEVVGKLSDLDRYYVLTSEPYGDPKQGNKLTTKELPASHSASSVWHYPGAYFNPRVIIYPGEDEFDGKISYGMFDDIPYYDIPYQRVAILGNGAFAVENIRTCMEFGAEKVFLVTRRKNLPSPRLCCWFVHQAILPVPSGMLLKTFEKMFNISGFGDPWDYHSVYGKKGTNPTIKSQSRFGIGDVTFLATAWGRCEYIVDTVKRFSRHTVHYNQGGKSEGVTICVKALGLLADFGADKMHKIKEMKGMWPNGDERRYVYADPLGMHFANITSMSTGIGTYSSVLMQKHLVDFPMEWRKVQDELHQMPSSVADENKPACQYDANYQTTCSFMTNALCPLINSYQEEYFTYFNKCVWACCPLDKIFDECKHSWDLYQMEWKALGFKHDFVPYPYTLEDVHSWMDEYAEKVGPLKEEDVPAWMEKLNERASQGKNLEDSITGDLEWWKGNKFVQDSKLGSAKKPGLMPCDLWTMSLQSESSMARVPPPWER